MSEASGCGRSKLPGGLDSPAAGGRPSATHARRIAGARPLVEAPSSETSWPQAAAHARYCGAKAQRVSRRAESNQVADECFHHLGVIGPNDRNGDAPLLPAAFTLAAAPSAPLSFRGRRIVRANRVPGSRSRSRASALVGTARRRVLRAHPSRRSRAGRPTAGVLRSAFTNVVPGPGDTASLAYSPSPIWTTRSSGPGRLGEA
jgi:hypothetical protein